MGYSKEIINDDWWVLALNTKKLNDHLMSLANGRTAFVTAIDDLATGSGLHSDDVRTSAAVLLFAGKISDILPVSGDKIRVLLRSV